MLILYKIFHKLSPPLIHRWFKSMIYKSERVGRNGKIFEMYKFRTLKPGADGKMFTSDDSYTWCGKFLRKYKLDELPQFINVFKGEMAIVGPRPEEKRTIDIIPEETKKILLSIKPGLTDIASIFFFDEERLLEGSKDKQRDYWTKIKPIKFILQIFYVENKCLSLDLWILWATFKRIIKEIFKP